MTNLSGGLLQLETICRISVSRRIAALDDENRPN